MTAREIFEKFWENNPFLFRNNRGFVKTKNGIIRFGIPEPRGKEKATDMKGGDYIGWREIEITPEMVGQKIAVFTNVEVKTLKDKIKPGQISWHNFIKCHGGISEFWIEKKGDIIEIVIDL